MLNKVPEIAIAFWIARIMAILVSATNAGYLVMHMRLETAATFGGSLYASTAVFAVTLAGRHLRDRVRGGRARTPEDTDRRSLGR